MGIIHIGTKETDIGLDEYMVKCPSCEADNFADVMFVSKYFHFWFIPVYPIEKEVNIICKKCGLRRYNLPLEKRLFSDFDEVNRKFRHPWYTYAFVGLIVLIIMIAIFF